MSTKQKVQEKKKLTYVDENISKLFEIKKRLGKGAYGIVWKALDKRTNETLAVKKIFDAFRDETDAQRTFREICFLNSFRTHPNVVKLLNVYRAANNLDIYLVFEYMESDLHNIIKKGSILKDIHKRFVMYQLLNAIRYIHSGNVIHRDMKPSNVLIDSKCRCKLADFGLARSLSSQPLKDNQESTDLPPLLTDYVATRWYRAPEILVASKRYTKGIDMWSLGCILAEMLRGKPLFQGSSTINQIEKIICALPDVTDRDISAVGASFGSVLLSKQGSTEKKTSLDELIADAPNDALDMVKSLLVLDPLARLTANEAIDHPYVGRFRHSVTEVELEQDILPPFRDDVRLSVSEYRAKLYEIAQYTSEKSQNPTNNNNNNMTKRTNTATKRNVPVAQPVAQPSKPPRETKYLERTVNENPQISKKFSKVSLGRVSNVISSTTLTEESVINPNPSRKISKTSISSPTMKTKQFESFKAPNRNRISEDLRSNSVPQNNPIEKKMQQSRNKTPNRVEYLNYDNKRHSIDGGYGSLPVDSGSSDKTPKIHQSKIYKSSSITKLCASESHSNLMQHQQRMEKLKEPTPKATLTTTSKLSPEKCPNLQRSSSVIISGKAPRFMNDSILEAPKARNDSFENSNFCYDARIKKIEAAVAGFKDDIRKFAKETKYHSRTLTPTRNVVPTLQAPQYQQTPVRYPQVRSKYTGGNTISAKQSISTTKLTTSMQQIVPAEGNFLSTNATNAKRNPLSFPSLQRERTDYSILNHMGGGSGDHLGRSNHNVPLEPAKSNDRYKCNSKTHHILQQQQQLQHQQQSRNRISSKVI